MDAMSSNVLAWRRLLERYAALADAESLSATEQIHMLRLLRADLTAYLEECAQRGEASFQAEMPEVKLRLREGILSVGDLLDSSDGGVDPRIAKVAKSFAGQPLSLTTRNEFRSKIEMEAEEALKAVDELERNRTIRLRKEEVNEMLVEFRDLMAVLNRRFRLPPDSPGEEPDASPEPLS
ncbi:hypothetical protein LOC68_01700 [Blastopirellula sp. JC732]|uniref:Uncharacterized protein n=1 Tax=Blastopirellula sediminis TaxID=2894196 RepID=A0A9X1MKF2_9BACT|nr:hypothetical protein [Blastopirellula sediminis]MCC9608098.1 hypothetical protein [Blastopirellula sediminis]MCC9627109.1 hypothetical protein [Blastopirellula sediminis]